MKRPAVLVLLHSSLSSARQWHALTPLLADGQACYAPDLIGYGAQPPISGPAFGHDLAAEAERVLALVSARHGAAPLHLVGHSYGGAVALRMATLAPDRVRSLALFEPTAFHLLPPGAERGQALVVAARVEGALAANRADLACEQFVDFWSGPGAFAAMAPAQRQRLIGRVGKVPLDFRALFDDPVRLPALARLGLPMLVLHGSHSPACALAVAERLGRLPGCTREGMAGRHLLPLTRPASVNRAVLGFLARQGALQPELVPDGVHA